jgi:hypothetical protein
VREIRVSKAPKPFSEPQPEKEPIAPSPQKAKAIDPSTTSILQGEFSVSKTIIREFSAIGSDKLQERFDIRKNQRMELREKLLSSL